MAAAGFHIDHSICWALLDHLEIDMPRKASSNLPLDKAAGWVREPVLSGIHMHENPALAATGQLRKV